MTAPPYEVNAPALRDIILNQEDFFLLDVREPQEYAICNLGGHLIPLAQLPARLDELDKNKRIIIHCKSGGRSYQALQFLLQMGFSNVQHLQGGILAWVKEVDPSMVGY